jgi:hypothetical protein
MRKYEIFRKYQVNNLNCYKIAVIIPCLLVHKPGKPFLHAVKQGYFIAVGHWIAANY